jgi:16S rRNA processing protein RimM
MALERKSSQLPFRRLPGRGIGEDELELGFVSGIFGVGGEVRLHVYNRDTAIFSEPLQCVLVDTNGDRYACECTARPGAGKRVIGRLEGLSDRNLAAQLRDFKLVLAKERLPASEDDEFYFHEVIGMAVWAGGSLRGQVSAVHATSVHEVFEVQTSKGPVFVPAVQEFVIGLDKLEGRLELEAAPFEDDPDAL